MRRTPSGSGPGPAPAIEALGLTKTYTGGVRALDGLDLSVAAGTVVGLLGPNGAGKSTTVKILTTLSTADSGEATVAGIDVVRRPADVRRAIGVVAQRSGLDPEATAHENLVLQGVIHGMRRSEAVARSRELLDRVDLVAGGDRSVKTFSGGMRRKLDVALGLVHRPQVLFLDEPTTGLDPEARAALWAEIDRLTRAEGITVLLTTHYLDEADRLADRVAIIDRGRIVVEGTPEELKGELRGDTIHLELDPDLDRTAIDVARAVLAGVAGVHEVVMDGRTVHARADAGAQAVPAVIAALEAASITVTEATVARPSLDDVYLRYAGRVFGADAPDRDPALQGA